MSALFEVLTIAIGTAVLAAVIVAADWDLVAIHTWQSLTAQHPGRDRPEVSSRPFQETDVARPAYVGPRPAAARFEPSEAVLPAASNTDRARADAWLAAAAAHRLPNFARAEPSPHDEASVSLPATSLRDALAARRGDPRDAQAA